MAWIDAGVNLTDPRFTLADVLCRASCAEVNHVLVISSSIEQSAQAIELCHQNNSADASLIPYQQILPKSVKLACTAGIHPHYADSANPQSWTKLKALIADKQVRAIGECGLDFNRNFSTKANQLYAFEHQLSIAAEYNMGVYLHQRDAFDEQVRLLEQYAPALKFMVSHCFTGNTEQLQTYVSLGCYIGITGWLCDDKRGQELQQAVRHLPLSRLLLETDAPYLFPKTLKPRKSTNEPCNLPHIANALSIIMDESIISIQQHAYHNAYSLFFSPSLDT